MSDLMLDADGDIKVEQQSWSELLARIGPSMRTNAQWLAQLRGRTYPYPFRYLASWSEARRTAGINPMSPEDWAELGKALDAKRGEPSTWKPWDAP